MKRLFCLVLVCSGIAALAACGGKTSGPPPATPAGDGSNVKAPGDAKVGDTTRCPVTGEEFLVEATSPKVEHQGSTYYFCCSSCKKKFEANPDKFVAPAKPSAALRSNML